MELVGMRNMPRMWVRWLLLLAFALALALVFSGRAFADDTYSARDQSGNSVRLLDEPCAVTSGWLKLRKAEMRYQGKDYGACWVLVGKVVLVFDDNGDVTPLELHRFTKDVTS